MIIQSATTATEVVVAETDWWDCELTNSCVDATYTVETYVDTVDSFEYYGDASDYTAETVEGTYDTYELTEGDYSDSSTAEVLDDSDVFYGDEILGADETGTVDGYETASTYEGYGGYGGYGDDTEVTEEGYGFEVDEAEENSEGPVTEEEIQAAKERKIEEVNAVKALLEDNDLATKG